MTTKRGRTLRKTIERALLTRDRLEMKAVERILPATRGRGQRKRKPARSRQ